MRYMGGKSRIAGWVSDSILELSPSRTYYLEPFIGGGSVFSKLAPNFDWAVAGDFHPDLVLMWNALIFDGWVPPVDISESYWRELKVQPEPSAERGYVGFAASFGGRWFESVARDKKNPPMLSHSPRSLMALRGSMKREGQFGRFRNWSYADWKPVAGTTVYCDPPYAGTKEYNEVKGFDHAHFWATMDRWVDSGYHVFVSEYSAPIHWAVGRSMERRVGIRNYDDRQTTATENLYTRAP